MADRVAGSPEDGLKVSSSSVEDVRFGPFRFDAANGFLYRDGVVLPLPPRAVGVLAVLAAHPGQVVSKQALLDEVWKDTNVTDTSLAEAVSLLRQSLGDDPQRGEFIQTIPRRGYRFVAPLPSHAIAPPTPAVSADAAGEALWTPWLPWLVAILSGVVMASMAWNLRPGPTLPRETIARFSIALPSGFSVVDDGPALAFAPDSAAIAFVASRGAEPPVLFVRSLADPDSRPLLGTDGAEGPFFSPDGQSIGYFAHGQLWRIDLQDGKRRPLAAAPSPGGAVWTAQDEIVFGAHWGEGLTRVPAAGGAVRVATRIDRARGERRHAWPEIGAPGDLLLFASVRAIGERQATDVRAWSPPISRTLTLVPSASFPHVLPSALVLAWRQSRPVVAHVDPRTLHVDEAVVEVPLLVRRTPDGMPLVAVSNRGALVAVGGEHPTGLAWITSLGERNGLDVVVARGEEVVARVETPADETAPVLSPDETLVARQSNASGPWQIALARVAEPDAVTLVGPGTSPTWSRDGRTLWFLNGDVLMVTVVDGATAQSALARRVADGIARILGTAPDGRVLVVTRPAPATSLDVVLGWGEEVRARIKGEPRFPRSFR